MDFQHASIALLASLVLILAGMVGWLYWQQTRLFQNMNSIIMVIGELTRPQQVAVEAPPAEEPQPEDEEDDRASVEKDVEVVAGAPAPLDTDNLEDKTKKELHDLLTSRGIPFGKNDNKAALISLLKATS